MMLGHFLISFANFSTVRFVFAVRLFAVVCRKLAFSPLRLPKSGAIDQKLLNAVNQATNLPNRRPDWTLALCPGGGSVTRHGFAPNLSHFSSHIIFITSYFHTTSVTPVTGQIYTQLFILFHFHIHISFSYTKNS